MTETEALVPEILNGSHRALAEAITTIENRSSGYRKLVSNLHPHTGNADIIGITGSPGAGKSTLVDKMAEMYREQGQTVGVIAVDPSSPFSGGAVLGDRIRMNSTVGDMDVFFRSMSARGALGGLSTATTDAVKALDAFGKDKIIIETVGAGQNEIDVVKTADTVAVLVPPASGDDIQMLKAGILEIADIFVVNKADLDGADKTVKELQEMIHMQEDAPAAGHHGVDAFNDGAVAMDTSENDWKPPVVETVAKSGKGVDTFLSELDDRTQWLEDTGEGQAQERKRYAAEIQRLIREDVAALVEDQIEKSGGIEQKVDAVMERQTDPYSVADDLLDAIKGQSS
ncbi:methylmalonyl Co-A mutase-associated GTPase MeaB [Salinarchaeum sp. IM2453]|uniref:methylmalonyl Co-A mutase-associated GTPase MeaB n=1 Tax=Salinarchaeum sp. IM2453 TaxID=2862870 RepID=UPI001C836170|nr:methylmalonyl Co-A mutase-associated GTPase MeaB [Salinarchaeum sp. IM2453]QZA88292.1 methylmalonyl Co-A mutase-associated GTPase MeaB [Salinarchaeum sp. IM2453]